MQLHFHVVVIRYPMQSLTIDKVPLNPPLQHQAGTVTLLPRLPQKAQAPGQDIEEEEPTNEQDPMRQAERQAVT
jgi:hypothetical protein